MFGKYVANEYTDMKLRKCVEIIYENSAGFIWFLNCGVKDSPWTLPKVQYLLYMLNEIVALSPDEIQEKGLIIGVDL